MAKPNAEVGAEKRRKRKKRKKRRRKEGSHAFFLHVF